MIFFVGLSCAAYAQKNAGMQGDDEVTAKLRKADSLAFAAFNAHDADKLGRYFDPKLEFYNDGKGMTGYDATMGAFRTMFGAITDIRRELVPGTLRVSPIGKYGAVEEGDHVFLHKENGKVVRGLFHFVTVWHLDEGQWKMSLVVSVGHHPDEAERSPLRDKILETDSLLFAALLRTDAKALKRLIDTSLCSYDQTEGVQTYKDLAKVMEDMQITAPFGVRTLEPGTVRIYMMGSDVAIETGRQKVQVTGGSGTQGYTLIDFAAIWQLRDGQWKLSRSIMYGYEQKLPAN